MVHINRTTLGLCFISADNYVPDAWCITIALIIFHYRDSHKNIK